MHIGFSEDEGTVELLKTGINMLKHIYYSIYFLIMECKGWSKSSRVVYLLEGMSLPLATFIPISIAFLTDERMFFLLWFVIAPIFFFITRRVFNSKRIKEISRSYKNIKQSHIKYYRICGILIMVLSFLFPVWYSWLLVSLKNS
ncbi:MAG: hypothetical protein IPL23_08010 [Saprospiraceae bacterium]|nr:hypothetical protein [Saprospiraceae bacterium]